MKEKTSCLEERDNEINQLKTSLRERDQDIERANQMLLTTEETIDVCIGWGWGCLFGWLVIYPTKF